MKMTPPITFDALPYAILRRVLLCLDRRDMVEVSCADVKRAVLSFSLWERTPRREGGGCFRHSDEDDGDGGSDSSPGAPIYRFLRIEDREEERQRDGGRDLKTVLASYPRSGNSLLRRLLEEVTGIITGSDTRPDRTLSRILSVFGMQGEGVVDERVRVVKTHFPERKGFREFEGKRVVLLVRNPFDSIDSYFNMALTNTHNKSLHECVYSELAEHWDAMIRNEIKASRNPGPLSVWERFYSYWLTSGVPVHVIRFEDLVSRPEDCLRDAVAFIHEISAKEVEEIFGDRIRRAPAALKHNLGLRGVTRNTQTARNTTPRVPGLQPPARTNQGRPPAWGAVSRKDFAVFFSEDKSVKLGFSVLCTRPPLPIKNVRKVLTQGNGLVVNVTWGGVIGITNAFVPLLSRPCSTKASMRDAIRLLPTPPPPSPQVAWCVREARTYLRLFGYDPESQGFPPISGVDLPLLKPPLPRPERRHAECNDSGGVASGSASADAGLDACSGVANSEADRQVWIGVGECPYKAYTRKQMNPLNGKQASYHAEHNRRAVTVTVNDENSSPLVRDKEDAFGRALTMFRRAHTARDTRPLPLQGENGKAEQWQCRRRREE
ncbi:unnamed protein product [Ascophyllum nodosum]